MLVEHFRPIRKWCRAETVHSASCIELSINHHDINELYMIFVPPSHVKCKLCCDAVLNSKYAMQIRDLAKYVESALWANKPDIHAGTQPSCS